MPISSTFTFDTSLTPVPPPPPDTPRTYAVVAKTVPAAVTAAAVAYSTTDEMELDGWGTSYPAYAAMAKLLAQEPAERAVSSVVVVCRQTAVANVWTFDIISTEDGAHTLLIDGVLAASFTASSNTVTEIKDGLISAFNLGDFAATHLAATVDTETGSITALVDGIPFVLTGTAPAGTAPTMTETVESVGIYEDLAAAYALLPFWGINCPAALEVEYAEAVRWAQADTTTRRCFVFQDSASTDIYDSTSTDNFAVDYLAALHPRVNVLAHPTAADYAQACAIGRLGGGFPGKRAQHYIALSGSTETTITANRTTSQVDTLKTRRCSRTERYFGPTSDLLLLAEDPNIPSGQYVFQRHAEDWWWYTVRVAIDAYMKSAAGVNLDKDGLVGLAAFVGTSMIPLLTENVIADDYTVGFTDLALVPAGELALGDFKSSGRILAAATITPKLRSLRVSAEFALV